MRRGHGEWPLWLAAGALVVAFAGWRLTAARGLTLMWSGWALWLAATITLGFAAGAWLTLRRRAAPERKPARERERTFFWCDRCQRVPDLADGSSVRCRDCRGEIRAVERLPADFDSERT